MPIENMQNILRQREQQFGSMERDLSNNDFSELIEQNKLILDGIQALSDNQKKIYEALQEIKEKLSGSEDAK